MSVALLTAAIDALAALDDAELGASELVRALAVQASRLDAVVCRQARAFQKGDVWRDAGAETSPDWVAVETRLDRGVARRNLRVGTAMTTCDRAAVAFAAGEITKEHVEVLARARNRNRTTAQAYERDEPMLLEWAASKTYEDFRWTIEVWIIAVDTHDAERRAARAFERRRLHLSQSLERQWYLSGELDPMSGDIVQQALERIEHDLFLADWAEAEARLGRDPLHSELARTNAQRRADALVEMARRAGTSPAGGKAPKPLVTIIAGEESFARMCRLSSGVPVTPAEAARVLGDAVIESVIHDAAPRKITVTRRRSFRGALRRAIEVAGGRCGHHYCNTPAERCEVDHVEPWARGGLTDLDNGRLRCGFHNRRRNHASDDDEPDP